MATKRNVKIVATPAKPAPVTAKPVLGAVAAKQAAAGRSNVAKPATPATPETVARVPRGVNRTAATIAKQATNFGGVLSERDTAYLAFYGSLARLNHGTVTVADIATSGRAPVYSGSCKPHDAGVIVRLTKAGLCTVHDNGHRVVFTDKAKALAAYRG